MTFIATVHSRRNVSYFLTVHSKVIFVCVCVVVGGRGGGGGGGGAQPAHSSERPLGS